MKHILVIILVACSVISCKQHKLPETKPIPFEIGAPEPIHDPQLKEPYILIGNEKTAKCRFNPDGADGVVFNISRPCPGKEKQAAQLKEFGFKYTEIK